LGNLWSGIKPLYLSPYLDSHEGVGNCHHRTSPPGRSCDLSFGISVGLHRRALDANQGRRAMTTRRLGITRESLYN
jgi:hypothetical protein